MNWIKKLFTHKKAAPSFTWVPNWAHPQKAVPREGLHPEAVRLHGEANRAAADGAWSAAAAYLQAPLRAPGIKDDARIKKSLAIFLADDAGSDAKRAAWILETTAKWKDVETRIRWDHILFEISHY